MLAPLKKIRVEDRDLQNVQDNVSIFVNSIKDKQILDGRLIESIVLDSGSNPTSIAHGLGRTPRGWIVVGQDAAADIYSSVSDTPTATLDLNCSADVTISLWVF